MKKFFKRLCPAIILALTLCVGAFMFTACGEKDVEFKADVINIAGFDTHCSLMLKTDKTAEFNVAIDNEGETAKQIAKMLSATGTYTFKDNVYDVTLNVKNRDGSTKEVKFTSTYDEATKTYTLNYTMEGDMGKFPVALKYTKA